MKRLLMIFIILSFSIWLGLRLSQDPGYFLLSFNQWSIQTTLSIALIALLALFIIFHELLVFLRKLSNSPYNFQRWKGKRKQQKARAKTEQGLIEFSEGYWLKAKDHLIKALPDADNPLLNYLTAARAAQEMNDYKLRDHYLREAGQAMPEAKIAVELTQAQLQLANHQWEQALATLQHLHDLAPSHPYVLKLLMQLYKDVKDWPQLIKFLPELKRNSIINNDEFTILEQQANLQALKDLTRHDSAAAHKFFTSLPKNLSKTEEILAEYCEFLIKEKEYDKAEILLRQQLRKRYSERLIDLYSKVKSNNKQLNFAESLIKKHPHSAALYLCLGYLSIDNHLWGKAKEYLEKSLSLKPTQEAYKELGKLLENFNEKDKALLAFKNGLLLATKQD